MKLPPNFKLSHTTNPLKIKFQYTYENGEIFEKELCGYSLNECINILWSYSNIMEEVKQIKTKENFEVKYNLKTDSYMIFYKDEVVENDIDYDSLYNPKYLDCICNRFLYNKKTKFFSNH